MTAVTTRRLQRFIERRCNAKFFAQRADGGIWVFVSLTSGRTIGIIDRGAVLYLHDDRNPNDTPDNPTAKLRNGKKIREIKK